MKPTVQKRKHAHEAKGFSSAEITEAKLTVHTVKQMKLPVDQRRKTSYKENVALLKKLSHA